MISGEVSLCRGVAERAIVAKAILNLAAREIVSVLLTMCTKCCAKCESGDTSLQGKLPSDVTDPHNKGTTVI